MKNRIIILIALLASFVFTAQASAAVLHTPGKKAAEWALYMDVFDYSQYTGNAFTYWSGMTCGESVYGSLNWYPCQYDFTVGGQPFHRRIWVVNSTGNSCPSDDDVDGEFPGHTGGPYYTTTPGVRGDYWNPTAPPNGQWDNMSNPFLNQPNTHESCARYYYYSTLGGQQYLTIGATYHRPRL